MKDNKSRFGGVSKCFDLVLSCFIVVLILLGAFLIGLLPAIILALIVF